MSEGEGRGKANGKREKAEWLYLHQTVQSCQKLSLLAPSEQISVSEAVLKVELDPQEHLSDEKQAVV